MHEAFLSFGNAAFITALLTLSIAGCSGTTKTVESPVSEPVSVQKAERAEIEAPAPAEPEISPDLKALRACQNDVSCIQSAAHEIIDRNAPKEEKAEALRALVIPALSEEHISEAQLYAESALELDENDVETLKLLAKIAHKAGRDDEAVKYLKKAAQTGSEDSEVYAMEAAILLSYLDTERALDAAQKAIQIQPSKCEAVIVFADSLYASHQFNEAIEQYENADGLSCSVTEPALKNMGKIYEVHVQSPQKACQTYERLVKISPENAYYKASRDYQCAAVSE